MENDLKITVAVCSDCKGYKAATPKKGYKNIHAHFNQAKDLKIEMGDYLTLDYKKYESIQKNRNLFEDEVSAYDFENKYWICKCDCTPICLEIRSFEDACKKLNIPDSIPNFTVLPTQIAIQMIAFYQLTIITKALNEGWNPISDDYSEEVNYVYYPNSFFNSTNKFPYKHDYAILENERGENEYDERHPGFFLVFKSDGLAKYAGTQFRDLYLDYYQYPETYLNRYNNE